MVTLDFLAAQAKKQVKGKRKATAVRDEDGAPLWLARAHTSHRIVAVQQDIHATFDDSFDAGPPLVNYLY